MNPQLKRVLIWLGYAAGYLFALLLFAYLTFPYDRLKERIVGEFNAHQTGPNPTRLELDELKSYWFSGIKAEGVRLISPSPPPTDPSKKPDKPKVMSIDSAHARLSLLSLLIGHHVITFGADAFGGNVSGEIADSDVERNVEVDLDEVDLAQVPLVADVIGLPASGKLSGSIQLTTPEARLGKGEGKLSLKIAGLGVGDGKAKIKDMIAPPRIDAGELVLDAEVKGGQLKITQFSATGPDLEFSADGTVRLRDQPDLSSLSLSAKFKFTDHYANKNEVTKGLLGSEGAPGLFDLDPKNRRAKQADGFYGWRVSGTLSKPSFTPHGGGEASTPRRPKAPTH
ncbi:MAG TPA: type II secretion system protein GspN [Polyangiaceae bacterium]|nr:type II secretion system protein GspN [Polyangiaceae bacterium]